MRRVPTTAAAGAELVPMFRDHMELCGVGPGQTVMAFTNTHSNPAYITALMGAVESAGWRLLPDQWWLPTTPG